ncbi:PASTA domain-containing protein [Leifsonia sp. AG29]|uniref:PASTA domain-containing protein n=1 Tax=Leifsonia sp. AG29 TaxID=2598860 RepID=UPI00131DF19F|nr:PASTA domain-containing protein [Leifsonia sp. AG29]
MAGRHVERPRRLGRIGAVIVSHPFSTGGVVTAALVAALVVAPLGISGLMPAPDHSRAPVPPAAAPAVARSVPDVVGLTEPRAADVMRSSGFRTEVRPESGGQATALTSGVVIRQFPSAGERAAMGTKVVLTVAPAGTGGTTPPQNGGGSSAAVTVPGPTGPGGTSATGGVAGAGSGGAGTAGGTAGGGAAGSGGSVPAGPAPAPAQTTGAGPSSPAPAPQPPVAPAPVPVQPPPLPIPLPPVVPVPAPLLLSVVLLGVLSQ